MTLTVYEKTAKQTFLVIWAVLVVACSGTGSEDLNRGNMENEAISVGSRAPLFSLPDKDGKLVSLADYLGKQNLVIFFYPKDDSYGCTKEACSFRDHYEVFKEAGAEVIGISADGEESHRSFASKHRLPFILLSDTDRTVARRYNVGKSMGILPGRVTYVIDKEGIIRMIFSSQLNFSRHMEDALEQIRRLNK